MYKKLIKILLLVNLNNNINSMIDAEYSEKKINKIKITDPLKELIEKFKMPIENQTIEEIIGLLNTRLNSLTEEDFRIGLFSEEDFINVFIMFSQYRYFSSDFYQFNLEFFYEFCIKYQEKNFLEFQKLNLFLNSNIQSKNFLLTESSLIENGIRNKHYRHECTIIYNNQELLEILDEKFSLLRKTKILDDIFVKLKYQETIADPKSIVNNLKNITNATQIYERKDFESMHIINKQDLLTDFYINHLIGLIKNYKEFQKEDFKNYTRQEYVEHLIKDIITNMQFEIYEMCKSQERKNEKIEHVYIYMNVNPQEDYKSYERKLNEEILPILMKGIEIKYKNLKNIDVYINISHN